MLWRRLAVCLYLTDVLSSEPCSFPCAVGPIDADRAQKHGMDEFISANPCSFDHASLFEMVQRLTLDHRLNDTFCCLVRGLLIRVYVAWGWSCWLICGNIIHMCVCACAGMVQPRPGVCLGWVLCQERSSRLSQTSVLPAWSTGKSRKRGYYWPHSSSLQLCFLCLPCPWEQVCPNPFF